MTDNLLTVIGELDIILALTQDDPDVQEACYKALNALRSNQERVVSRNTAKRLVYKWRDSVTSNQFWSGINDSDWTSLIDKVHEALQLPKPSTVTSAWTPQPEVETKMSVTYPNATLPTVEELRKWLSLQRDNKDGAIYLGSKADLDLLSSRLHTYLTTLLKGDSHE
jgi:hypothetical protein